VTALNLPILVLPVKEQRYSCHGCGNCCRDFTVQLRAEDLAKLNQQGWEQKLGQPVTIEFRGTRYLRQRDDGSCIFLMDDGRCRIHAEFGFAAKPIACQLFPFSIMPTHDGLRMGINFACQSVLENKGATLTTHVNDLGRMAGELGELPVSQPPPMLTERLRAGGDEVESITAHIDQWLRRTDLGLPLRLDGLAWIVSSLAQAKLANVRGKRLDDLLDVLFTALPEELEHHPIEPAAPRQRKMLRRAVFARTEDPKLSTAAKQSRWRATIAQLLRERRFASGRGSSPRIGQGWPAQQPLQDVELVGAPRDLSEIAAMDDLMARFMRATILGGRCWGPGYYGWPIVRGLEALLLNVACIGWLARLHAAGRSLNAIDITAVRAALGRVDRSAGRAPWLGSAGETLRLSYLRLDDGLRRLLASYPLIVEPDATTDRGEDRRA
jgi:lysine-N-methylase